MIFSVDNVVEKNLPNVHNKPWLAVPTRAMLRYLLHEKQCNDMANEHAHLSGVDFVEQILACLNFSYSVPNNEIENIPIEGRVVKSLPMNYSWPLSHCIQFYCQYAI